MVNLKRKNKIIILTIIVIIIVVIFILAMIFLNAQKDDRVPEVFISFDESYCIRVVVDENIHDSVHYVNVIIYDNVTDEEVFSIRDEYRAFDFHWVTWENENNNFWIKSGDLGIFYYEYEGNNVWEKYSLSRENNEFFLVRGNGEKKEKKNIKLEDIKERLPERYSVE